MPIDEAMIRHTAALARLDLDVLGDEEVAALSEQLNRIVGWVETLQKVDVEHVDPMAHPVGLATATRVDEARPTPGAKAMLANAPQHDDEAFIVPQVVEDGARDA